MLMKSDDDDDDDDEADAAVGAIFWMLDRAGAVAVMGQRCIGREVGHRSSHKSVDRSREEGLSQGPTRADGRCPAGARRQIYAVGWEADAPSKALAAVVLHLTGQLHLITYGA